MHDPAVWRIASLNIWNRQGPWDRRLPLIRAGLAALDADVIGLQEVLAFEGLPNQADEIAAGLGWNVYHAPAWQIGGGLTFGNAILSPHRLFDTERLELPTPPGLDARSAVFARVDAPHGPIPVMVTHLTVQFHLCHVISSPGSRRWASRRRCCSATLTRSRTPTRSGSCAG
jgi:endonuclease/exonuclease/phosphatase family metal-dependent hydrolase